MGLLSGFWDDSGFFSWLGSAVTCCVPQQRRAKVRHDHARGVGPQTTVLHEQPRLISPPMPEPHHSRSSSREWVRRTKSAVSRVSTRASFSVKKKLNAYNGSRRPLIGAPTDFRHVQNAVPRRTDGFRPLELSIYSSSNRLSPLIVHFGGGEDEGPVLLYSRAAHTRSPSALSNFSIPRKPLNSRRSGPGLGADARISSDWVTHPLRPRPSVPESLGTHELLAALEEDVVAGSRPMTRLRSYTEPPKVIRPDSELFERVKSILHEKEEIERQIRDIDSIIEERQSIYLSSRAPSIFSASAADEPMPDLKPSALEQMPRPKTSPAIHVPVHAKSFSEASAVFSNMDRPDRSGPMPPPLPLVLQRSHPPLRKKKSFSHVSGWLNRAEHSRRISLDSVTNTPRPIKSREGFYQSLDLDASVSPTVSPIEETVQTPTAQYSITTEQSDRGIASRASVSTLSSLDTESDEATEPTEPTPNSSPGRPQTSQTSKTSQTLELARVTTFGEKQEEAGLATEFGLGTGPVRLSRVGVAF